MPSAVRHGFPPYVLALLRFIAVLFGTLLCCSRGTDRLSEDAVCDEIHDRRAPEVLLKMLTSGQTDVAIEAAHLLYVITSSTFFVVTICPKGELTFAVID